MERQLKHWSSDCSDAGLGRGGKHSVPSVVLTPILSKCMHDQTTHRGGHRGIHIGVVAAGLGCYCGHAQDLPKL